jgi:hypothetical protein
MYPGFVQKIEKGDRSQIFLKVIPGIFILKKNFRNRDPRFPEVPGEGDKCPVFLNIGVVRADGGKVLPPQADIFPVRSGMRKNLR